jgi:hypothetical protein
MISKSLRKSLPEGFRFSETSWFHAISGIHDKSNRRLLLAGLLLASVIAIAYGLIDLGQGEKQYLIYYLLWLAVSTAMLIYFFRSGRPDALTTPAIALLIAGFVLAVFLPNSRDIYLLIFLCFPLLALQLMSVRRGGLWTGIFFHPGRGRVPPEPFWRVPDRKRQADPAADRHPGRRFRHHDGFELCQRAAETKVYRPAGPAAELRPGYQPAEPRRFDPFDPEGLQVPVRDRSHRELRRAGDDFRL